MREDDLPITECVAPRRTPDPGHRTLFTELAMLGALIAVLACMTILAFRAPAAQIAEDVSFACSVARLRTHGQCPWTGEQDDLRGSAVAIAPRLALTCWHVVEESNSAILLDFYAAGAVLTIPVRVLRHDETRDLALLESEEEFPAAAVVGLSDARNLQPFDRLYCVGASDGLSPENMSDGRFVARGQEDNAPMEFLWQCNAAATHGASARRTV